MQKQRKDISQRAWNLLRLALLWARKGGAFKRRLLMDVRLFSKFLKTLGHSTKRGQIHYGEHELSFEPTPIIHIKMHQPLSMKFRIPCIPCLNPQVDFEYDFGFNDDDNDENVDVMSSCCSNGAQKSFLMSRDEDDDNGHEVCEGMIVPCDEGIDLKAEQFIAKFYEQMKLQRQISHLQYNEMLNRSTS